MNKRIDLTNLGGFPFTQDTLKFMQESYRDAFAGIAGLVGDKTILSGCDVVGANVTDGWIVYQGELIRFAGGVLGDDVVISENVTDADFEDGSSFPTYFEKVATTGIGGAFPFSHLVRLQSLQNIWLPGDIKDKVCTQQYINDNFDVDGYGLNREKGWRIMSKAIPSSAGRVLVSQENDDMHFGNLSATGGAKLHTLTISEMPKHRHRIYGDNMGGSGGVPYSLNNPNVSIAGAQRVGADLTTNGSGRALVEQTGSDSPHNNLQPYFVVLRLIKL